MVVGALPDDQRSYRCESVGGVPVRADIRRPRCRGIRLGLGVVVAYLACIVQRVGYGADPVKVANLVDLSPPLDSDLLPARVHRATRRTHHGPEADGSHDWRHL